MAAPETLADIAGQRDLDDLFGSIPDFELEDPLLNSGAFIQDTETLIDPVQPPEEPDTLQQPDEPVPEPDTVQQPEEPVQSLSGDPASEAELESPVPLKIVLPEKTPEKTAGKRGRRKKSEGVGTEVVIAAVNPDWMPIGWHVEERSRVSGASAGATDKYYCDPVSGHKFRSKVEAVYFLETGSRRKRKDKMDDVKVTGSSEKKQKQKKPRKSTQSSKFDFVNVPEKIGWVLTDHVKGSWTPYVGDDEVNENSKEEWSATFTSLSTRNGNAG